MRSHFPPNIEVYNLIETKKIRVIFNFRDPRDVCISRFNWQSPTNTKVTNLTREFQKKVHKYCFENDEQFIESIIKGEKYIEEEFVLGDMFRHARGLLFHPYVHKTRFEELIGPKGGGDLDTQFNAIANLLKFLDIDKNPVEIAAKAFSSKAETFHKGQIGKYKDVFTNEHIMLFNKLHGDILHEYGYI
ncbi:MAG: sulfotransferase domain-containing protein [Asgard group archaeon]|nr:sulfotransferase domain-containing protein [Asgard group archaeon]